MTGRKRALSADDLAHIEEVVGQRLPGPNRSLVEIAQTIVDYYGQHPDRIPK
ncbi:hypothetical protein AB0L57_29190 [Nocardia sp. NPDC052254]|jgi:hypothetical protein|uniref:hypothetical protein n=1 Tax=Nocardia sp. NPDC052254 TaxID=3155681 RepID=UPI00341BB561